MGFRVSDLNVFLNAVRNATQGRAPLLELTTQISSGKRLNRLSDDPNAATRVLSLARTVGELDQFERNVEAARGLLENTETSLASLTDTLVRLREIAVQGASGASDPAKIAPEVEELYDEILQLANTRVGERFLFGGFATQSAPFAKVGDFAPGVASPPPSLSNSGDSGALWIRVGEAVQVQANVAGREPFLGSFDGDDGPDAGRVDLFAMTAALRDRLFGLGAGTVGDSIGEIDLALQQVLEVRSQVGGRLRRLEIAQNQIADLRLTLRAERSTLEDVDAIAAISELTHREQTFQAALAVSARSLQPSLLDFLR
jgi:flagellar hook-associated protein 3 FlgL